MNNDFDKDKYNWNKDLERNGGCGRIFFFFATIGVIIQTAYHFLRGTLSIEQIMLTFLILGFTLVLQRIGD